MASTPWYQDSDIIRALLGAGGAALETYSQYQQSKQNREQQQQLSRAATLQGLFEGDQAEDFLRERTALDAFQQNPYAQLEADQRQAIRAALLSNISNVTGSFDPSTGRGSLSGGIDLSRLQDPSVQKFFSEPARLAARQEFDLLRAAVAPNVPIGGIQMGGVAPTPLPGARPNPNASLAAALTSSFSPIGSYVAFGPAGTEAAQTVAQFGSQRFADLQNRRNVERDAIMRALEGDIAGQKKEEKKSGGGFLGFLGKVLPFVAAPFTAGLSLPAGLAASAGIGAASAALQGQNPITGALGGVATGALGRVMPRIPGTGASAGTNFTPAPVNSGNPQNPYSGIFGARR